VSLTESERSSTEGWGPVSHARPVAIRTAAIVPVRAAASATVSV
jgi:hypothetical protein